MFMRAYVYLYAVYSELTMVMIAVVMVIYNVFAKYCSARSIEKMATSKKQQRSNEPLFILKEHCFVQTKT